MRYKAVKGSVSGHCCFEASVVDLNDNEEMICECPSIELAQMICDTLNKESK